MNVSTKDLEDLLKLFTFTKKRDLEKYSRNLIIKQSALANFILGCEAGVIPLIHMIHHKQDVPKHLQLKDEDHKALAENGVGPMNKDALRAANKVFQIFETRRLLVGHIFYTPDLEEWHFMYFDQRDTESRRPNHWKAGSHLHFMNWLWPRIGVKDLWEKFTSENLQIKGSLHIKFERR